MSDLSKVVYQGCFLSMHSYVREMLSSKHRLIKSSYMRDPSDVTQSEDFIYLYLGDNISRALKLIKSNQPYYTTLDLNKFH